MKKQLSLIAAGASLVLAAAPSFAQTTPAVGSAASVVTQTLPVNGNPDQFSVSGTIEEFVQITNIDSNLELGNIGGAVKTGVVRSFTGSINAGSSTTAVTKDTDTGAGLGDARVDFRANTFLTIGLSSSDLKNETNSAFTLPTSYRVAGRGRIEFKQGGQTVYGPADLPNNTAVNTDGYASFSAPFAAADASGLTMTYSPGAASSNPLGANADNGLRIAAEVTRKGLQDYRGTYSTKINLTYAKF